MDGGVVCLKVLRYFTSSSNRQKLFKVNYIHLLAIIVRADSYNLRLIQELSNEVLIWRQLSHPNILKFHGINLELFQPSYCIVSPWMPKGNVSKFLQDIPNSAFAQKLDLVGTL